MTVVGRSTPAATAALAAPAALAAHDHAGRLQRATVAATTAGCDALLVSDLVNVRYLCGFTGSNGLLVVGAGQPVLVTDGRYRAQAAQELHDAGVDVRLQVESTNLAGAVVAAVVGRDRIGLEAASVTWAAQRRYAAESFAGRELIATNALVEEQRSVKEPSEVARIEAAAAIADAALAACLPLLRNGPSESAFALELELAMRRLGAGGAAFETIVASGPNAALPHARPGERCVSEGDLVVLDFGAMVDGYRSDMTRTVCVGEPTAAQREMFDLVVEAQRAARDSVAPGVSTGDVDGAARKVIESAGRGEAFSHGTGHGVGLQIHEAPLISRHTTSTLQLGQVVTVEPGVYLEGVGGVRVEDTVVVTEDGCRVLTNSPIGLSL